MIPKDSAGQPKVVALRQTSVACPSQWEGTLEDGRAVYVRYRYDWLSVGVGDDVDQAVHSGSTDRALYAGCVGAGLDGFMDLEELKFHLRGVLAFPVDLVVENE
jgi:hypothetical protein